MKWELPPDDSDGDDNVVMDHVATLGDAVRGLHMDKWSLTAVAYDGSCNVWDFWNQEVVTNFCMKENKD